MFCIEHRLYNTLWGLHIPVGFVFLVVCWCRLKYNYNNNLLTWHGSIVRLTALSDLHSDFDLITHRQIKILVVFVLDVKTGFIRSNKSSIKQMSVSCYWRLCLQRMPHAVQTCIDAEQHAGSPYLTFPHQVVVSPSIQKRKEIPLLHFFFVMFFFLVSVQFRQDDPCYSSGFYYHEHLYGIKSKRGLSSSSSSQHRHSSLCLALLSALCILFFLSLSSYSPLLLWEQRGNERGVR